MSGAMQLFRLRILRTCFYVADSLYDYAVWHENYLLFNYSRTCQNGPEVEKIMKI